MIPRRYKCCGSALISALLIMALVAIAATAMSMRLQLDIYRTRMSILNDQLSLSAQAVTFWSMGLLSQPALLDKKVTQAPKSLQNIYPGIIVQGQLVDMQSRFNLNNLQDIQYHSIFFRLLEKTIPHLTAQDRQYLINATAAWINPYRPDQGQDPWAENYLKHKPPYLPAYQVFTEVSEFRLVAGVTDEIFQALLPYITTLPEVTPINLNTAPKAILMALSPNMTEEKASDIIIRRQTEKFKYNPEFNQLLTKYNLIPTQVTLNSYYFESQALASSPDLTQKTLTLLKRGMNNKGNIDITLIMIRNG